MLQSLLGAVIMSVATASLLIAIKVGDNSLTNTKYYPLTSYERELINKAGYTAKQNIQELNLEIEDHIDYLLEVNYSD